MVATQFAFLEERLSGFRGQYLPQIERNLPELLVAFDAHVLGAGYSGAEEERFRTHDGYAAALGSDIFAGVADRPVYEKLTSALSKLQGEARLAFLYGLRRALVTAQAVVNEQEAKMDNLQEGTDILMEAKDFMEAEDRAPSRALNTALDMSLEVLYDQILRLRGASSGYRDVYRVMVDAVKQALPK